MGFGGGGSRSSSSSGSSGIVVNYCMTSLLSNSKDVNHITLTYRHWLNESIAINENL